MTEIQQGLTFDDILLVPHYSAILPKDVQLSTQLTRNIHLSIPLISAAMDTVTESTLAIRLAQEGGIGIVHKNLSPDLQAREVLRVKKSESVIIRDPITISPHAKISQALEIMSEHNISGLPVVDGEKLVGILTNRDLRLSATPNTLVSEVMTSKLITVEEPTHLNDAQLLLHKHRIEKLLVVDGMFRLTGLITYKDIEKAKQFPQSSKDEYGRLLVGAAIGMGDDQDERIEKLIAAGVDCLVLDSAHGHSQNVMTLAKQLKKAHAIDLIVGNIATESAAKALLDIGVDAIKVGVGPGSICTTRIVAGVGVPQITAIMECHKATKNTNVPIIADGGIRYSGDVIKSLAVGAHSVMIGNLFAGTEESPGKIILYQGRSYKEYRGMGSLGAMKHGSKDRYFQGNIDQSNKFVPEGIEGRTPYKGPIEHVIYQLLGGVRSGMGYLGAADIPKLKEHAKLIQITHASLNESHVHDVDITQEAPNYQPN